MAQGGIVRISKEAHQTLRQLAEVMGESMQAIVEKAIEELRRKRMIEEANTAYAALRNDPDLWREESEERRLSEATVRDNLEPNEVWSEDGSATVCD